MNFNVTITNRGFIGHEQLDSVGLVHMNGRVYDAELGRFLSADPHVQQTHNLQNWNRYSYVLNNPLSYTDPTGFFFKKLFKAVGRFFKKVFKAIGRVLKKALRLPILRAIVQIVACGAGPVVCGAVSAGLAAASGGSIGDILQAAAFGFVVPQIWDAVGGFIEAYNISRVGQALIHGVVNGAVNAARGGRFLAGFASGVIGKVTGFASYMLSNGDKYLDTAIVAAGGCAGAVIAKGSCANGAISAAFANMYNKYGDKHVINAKIYREGSRGQLHPEAIEDASWIYDVFGGVGGLLKGGFKFALRQFCSFHGDTQVATDKGFVKIRKIRPEQHKVWARDEHTGKMKFQPVLEAYSNPYKETVTITIRDRKTGQQQTIVSNKIHPFYVSTGTSLMKLVTNGGFVTQGTNDTGEWIKAEELKPGHHLLNAGKKEHGESWSEVVSVKIAKENLRAYNLHVDQFHTFYVRGADNDNAPAVWAHNDCSIKGLLKAAELPTKGKIRFVPPKSLKRGGQLRRGPNNGYIDRFDNEWIKGPGRGGDAFEWDVQLSRRGRNSVGWLSKRGSHINVSRDGKVTH